MKRVSLSEIIVLIFICFEFGAANKVILTRPQSVRSNFQIEFSKRLIPAQTVTQNRTAPFQRFRFQPPGRDLVRIEKLQQGGVDTVRVLCIRVEFVEDTTPLTTGNGKFDTLGFLSPDSGLFLRPASFQTFILNG